MRPGAGHLNERIASGAAVFQSQIFVSECAILNAFVVMAAVDRFAVDLRKIDISEDLRVVFGVIDAVGGFMRAEAIEQKILDVGPNGVMRLPRD